MFEARGYEHVKEHKNNDIISITATYNDLIRNRVNKIQNIKCYFVPFDNKKNLSVTGKSSIKILLNSGFFKGISHVIFIVDNISFQCKSYLRQLNLFSWEVFTYKSLSFNILEHVYVPKYRLLTEVETQAVEKKTFTKRKQFPQLIYQHDSVAKFLNCQIGDIWETQRKTTGEISWRIVVPYDSVI